MGRIMTIKENSLAYFDKASKAFAPLKAAETSRKPWSKVVLLSGDIVYVIRLEGQNAIVSAKGHHLKIPTDQLTEEAKLHVYFIDCGQGDAALVHFPDGRWMMIDGGPPRKQGWTNTGKIAFDFLKWKIYRDFSWRKEFNYDPHKMKQGTKPVPFHLDSIVISHPDYDHYAGLHELIGKIEETDPFERITVGTIYHCGLGRFSKPHKKLENGSGMSQLGPIKGDLPDAFLTTLIDDFADVRKYSKKAGRRDYYLDGDYASWIKELARLEGKGVGAFKRIHHKTNGGYLPSFEEDKPVSIKILGPVEERSGGKPALRYIDTKSAVSSPSKTRNGLSVVLRLDYKKAKVLMTGDLNFKSQAVLLKHIDPSEFQSHIVKACHHGSDDVSWKFLQATDPAAVVFSSGDNESHIHPRAKILGWSAAFARKMKKGRSKSYLGLKEENLQTPLIYSTELSRSSQLWEPYSVLSKKADGSLEKVKSPYIQPRGRSESTKADQNPSYYKKWLLADRLIYGMVNMRTDGEIIEMGVMAESGDRFLVEKIDPDWSELEENEAPPSA